MFYLDKHQILMSVHWSGFFSASGHNSSNSELYIGKALLHIGAIAHQIKKYIEVASMCPYLEQKTTTV
jgi:hypothetical protein